MIPEQLKDITLTANRILLTPLKIGETKTKSGLITSLSTKDTIWLTGVIQMIGPEKASTEEGKTIPYQVKVGDIVRFNEGVVKETKINGETFYILPEGEAGIIAIVGKVVDGINEIYVDE